MTINGKDDLTWPALLAQWTDFAKASVALPRSAEGERWRAAVAPIIALQAVTMALKDINRLRDESERALALDKAEMVIRRHASELHELWRREPMERELIALMDDARRALAAAGGGGLEWRVSEDGLILDRPADLIDALLGLGFRGDVMLAAPGVRVFDGAPVAFARARFGGAPDEAVVAEIVAFLEEFGTVSRPAPVEMPRQVYRQFDFGKGGPVRDFVARMDSDLPPGQPILLPVIEGGEARPVPLPPRRVEPMSPLPVEFEAE